MFIFVGGFLYKSELNDICPKYMSPVSSYKMKTLGRIIYFHINYLTDNVSDIQCHIKDTMNKMVSNEPYGPIVKVVPAKSEGVFLVL